MNAAAAVNNTYAAIALSSAAIPNLPPKARPEITKATVASKKCCASFSLMLRNPTIRPNTTSAIGTHVPKSSTPTSTEITSPA